MFRLKISVTYQYTVADWVLIIGLKISHFFATALILKACIEQEIQLGCYQMNTVTPKDT